MGNQTGSSDQPIAIKKYANRRLYNTDTSCYVTLDHLCQMVKEGIEFYVVDAKSGDDITRSVLTQIIVEEENKGQNLLPVAFLRQLIGLYGDNMQWMVPDYLEQSMTAFARNQEQMRSYLKETMQGVFPFSQFGDMGKKQAVLFEQALQVFRNSTAHIDHATAPTFQTDQDRQTVLELRQQLEEIQAKLDTITQQTKDTPKE